MKKTGRQSLRDRWVAALLVGALALVFGAVEAKEQPTPDLKKLDALLFPKRDQLNEAHASLMKMSDKERAAALALLLKKSGEECGAVTRTFFQGAGSNGDAFWNVACADGGAYLIQVNGDKEGTTQILECSMLEAVGGGHCFKKFP